MISGREQKNQELSCIYVNDVNWQSVHVKLDRRGCHSTVFVISSERRCLWGFILIWRIKEIGNSSKSTCRSFISITSMHDSSFLLPWLKDFSSLLSTNTSCANKAKASSLISFFSSALSFPFLSLLWDKKTNTHSIVNWSRAIHSIFTLLFLYFYYFWRDNFYFWYYYLIQRDLFVIIKMKARKKATSDL